LTYAMEVWGSAKASNIVRIQRFQSKVFQSILDAPWYVSKHTIHTDLNIPFISDLIKTRFQQFPHHPVHPSRRLNRQWPRDLLWGIAIESVTDGWLLPSSPHAIIYYCHILYW
jgi:hypothetical protein